MPAAGQHAPFGLLGWKVETELTNPVNFDAAVAHLDEDDIRAATPSGPGPEPHVEAARAYLDAGFDDLVLMCTGGDVRGSLRFATEEMVPRVAMSAASGARGATISTVSAEDSQESVPPVRFKAASAKFAADHVYRVRN